MRGDLIDRLAEVADDLRRLQEGDDVSAGIVIASCLSALKIARGAEGLTPTQRQKVRSSYRMAAAYMGVEHE